eukprot:2505189-Amphidinium_carterae.2
MASARTGRSAYSNASLSKSAIQAGGTHAGCRVRARGPNTVSAFFQSAGQGGVSTTLPVANASPCSPASSASCLR